jgi:REP-associated tyrosine transposase
LKKEGTLPTTEKECNSNKFVYQELDYMHKNPVSKKWQLVNDFTDHLYSSASYYEKGIKQYDKLFHVNEVLL